MRVTSVCLGSLATNCYRVEVGPFTLLVDPAEDSAGLHVLAGHDRVDWIVHTHGHYDHVGGSWAIPCGGRAIHELDVPYVEQFFPGRAPFDRYLKDGEELVPGLKVLHAPGHSPGSVVFVGDGVLLVGDLLFAGSIGRTDFPGGSAADMEQSLRKLLALSGEYVVYPGHGGATTLERERRANPFLRGLG